MFNEGYDASAGEALIRRELCAEAIRLARVVADLHARRAGGARPARPDAADGRAAAAPARGRTASSCGSRTRIGAAGTGRGSPRARRSWNGRSACGASGPYQLQAAIAAVHDEAPSTDETDWVQILGLYEVLVRIAPSPVIALNRAVALAQVAGYETGLAAVDTLAGDPAMADYLFFHAARGTSCGASSAGTSRSTPTGEPLELTTNAPERAFLEGRLAEIRRRATAG